MTIRVAWSTVATLLLVVIPTEILAYFYDDIPVPLQDVFFVINNFNPLINAYIFLMKNPLMMKGFKAACRRQHLPNELKQWVK